MHVHIRLVVTFSLRLLSLSFSFSSSTDSGESLVHSLRFFVAGINFSHKVWQTLDLHINDLDVFGSCFGESWRSLGGLVKRQHGTLATWHHSSCQLFQRVLHFKRHEEKCQASSHAQGEGEKNNFLCVMRVCTVRISCCCCRAALSSSRTVGVQFFRVLRLTRKHN